MEEQKLLDYMYTMAEKMSHGEEFDSEEKILYEKVQGDQDLYRRFYLYVAMIDALSLEHLKEKEKTVKSKNIKNVDIRRYLGRDRSF